MAWERVWASVGERLRRRGAAAARELHLSEALGWLYRAQDATPDGGVSHSYELGRGWLPSYAETTGYIIPTLLNAAAQGAGRMDLENLSIKRIAL